MCSGAGDPTSLRPGFPIRTPSDHSSVDSSPRLIAASHVLHRLLVPRHPPCALNNFTTTQNKMLASTVQFSNNTRHPPTPTTNHPHHHPPHTHQGTALHTGWSDEPDDAATKTTHTHMCSLRTQQCTDKTPPHTPTTTHGDQNTETRDVSVPPMSTTPRSTNGHERGHHLHTPTTPSPPPHPHHHTNRRHQENTREAGTKRGEHRQALKAP